VSVAIYDFGKKTTADKAETEKYRAGAHLDAVFDMASGSLEYACAFFDGLRHLWILAAW
jgi:hypothetical protein